MGVEAYRATMAGFAEIAQRQDLGGPVEYLAAVSDVAGAEAAMPGAEPWEYYGTERTASAGWRNQVTRLSIRELLTFDAAIGADFIAPTPTLIVHGRQDGCCSPSEARAVYDRITGPKELMWLDTTNHIDLYDVATYVDPAVERIARWMDEYLRGAQHSTD